MMASVQAAPHWAACPTDVPIQSTFDVSRYAGQWYEVVRDYYTPFEFFLGCNIATYTPEGKDTITVRNEGHANFYGWTDIYG